MVHDYMLYVTFVTSKFVLRHPKRDASKNVSTPTVSENYEILCANSISRDDSNGTIHFIIRDLENKLRIFNRNYNFVIKITIFALIPKIGISQILQYRNRSQYMRHVSVILGHPISTGFRWLTGCQQDPRKLGHHRERTFYSIKHKNSRMQC